VIDPDVRIAVDEDLPELARLAAEARQALVDQRGGVRWLATHAEHAWADLIAEQRVLIGAIDAVPTSYLVIDPAGEVATIIDVYVTPEARLVGFGDALVELAIERARAFGCAWIEGEALPGDRDTKNLYERAGITARLIVVSRRL
jgi:GNAT superfamily N-acetyltransferase